MPTFIVSTVGTSLLTNGARREVIALLHQHANARDLSVLPEDDRAIIEGRIAEVGRLLDDAGPEVLARQSAEVNGLLRWMRESGQPDDQHLLVSTDTHLGRATAGLARRWLESNGHVVEHVAPAELSASDGASFRRGVSGLLHTVWERVALYREGGYRVVFNLCGGFKGINGFLHSAGALLADEVVYIFETGSSLLRVPRLPVKLDHDSLRAAVPDWRRLELGLLRPGPGLDPLIFEELDGQVYGSLFGERLMPAQVEAARNAQLLDPPDTCVEIGPEVRRSAAVLPERKRRQLNQRIEQLVRHMHDPSFNPPSLDVKRLRAEGRRRFAPATEEFDAWSDDGGRRVYFHREQRLQPDGGEQEVACLDFLDVGLH
jgi:putative CRISPR-associated protein (TIGR02619 family)